MASAMFRNAALNVFVSAFACLCATVTGLAGSNAATASPTSPPVNASIMRSNPPPALGGNNVATSTALLPACNAMTEPPSSNTAADMASPTTSAICQGPVPIQLISASPTPTPTETPTTSSPTRLNRCPSETPRHTTAAIGAKNGCSCPITSVATTQARPADRALWTIGNAAPRHRVSPRPTASLTALTAHPDH